jgi:dihydroorotate dehydrogenase
MNPYSLLRPLLFCVDPETAHDLSLKALMATKNAAGLLYPKVPEKPLNVMGLTFKNPVGLAAGLDKNGDCLDGLAALGFGFLEIGTVTPRPQAGNPKPRLFRLPEHEAIINRMGFNNKGIDYLLEQVKRSAYSGVLGINIGKNADTPIENALDDYLICFRKAYSVASYVTMNISSPNTKNLRQLQQGDELKKLISAMKEEQLKLQVQHGRYVPLVLKIAPDLTPAEVREIANLLIQFNIDGVIATNTTISRDKIVGHSLAGETGGLSGSPVKEIATQIVHLLAAELNGTLPIIAAGGVMNSRDAREKIEAGASLVQIYTGLIYKGASLVSEIVNEI